jgi:hypothetical protein
MDAITPNLLHLAWIVPLVLLIFFLVSPRFRGDIAQNRVRRILAAGLEKSRYTVFNDVLVPSGGGTTLVDHVVVSRSGIFVIASQYARGWISGTEVQERWKGYHLRRFTRFENPMHRNQLQQEALQSLLGWPATPFHRVVVLSGHKGFKGEQPDKVVEAEKLVAYLRKLARQDLSAEQANQALQAIDKLRLKGPATRSWWPLRLALIIMLVAGVYLAFQDDFADWRQDLARMNEQRLAPDKFHPDGSRKTEQELWEDALICAYSVDTNRCVCRDPEGSIANLDSSRCRELAERGSILEQ